MALILLAGCSGDDFDSFPVDSESNAEIFGGAVKGPLISAAATVYLIDYTAADLKGSVVTTGSTDSRGALMGIVVPGAQVLEAPLLIEYTGGTELDGSAPAIPTLRTIVTLDQLRNGVSVFATPLTTLILELARLNADLSDAASAAANFSAALGAQQQIVKDYFGLGILDNVDLFTTFPFSSFGQDPPEVLNHRTAIEVFGAIIVELNAIDINTPANDLLLGLAQDLADGVPDAAASGTPVSSLAGIGAAQLVATLTQPADDLMAMPVPGTAGSTMLPISALNQVLVSETAIIDPGLPTPPLLAVPTIHKIVPGDDSDGDLVIDSEDEFPMDPTQVGDSDMDGFDDLVDAFPDNINEWLDTDGDGVGDNGDAFPNDPDRQVPADNQVPVAAAGADATVAIGTPTTLDGSGSSDPESDPLTFAWQFASVPPGSVAIVNNAGTSMPSFTPDLVGDYVVNLTVNDGVDMNADSVVISAIDPGGNSAPVAMAVADRTMVDWANNFTETVMLDGSASSDPDNDPLTYAWSILSFVPASSGPSAPAMLMTPDMAMDTFSITQLGQTGTYTIRLTVSDGTLQDTVDVVVEVVPIGKVIPSANVLFGSGLFGMAAIGFHYRRRSRRT